LERGRPVGGAAADAASPGRGRGSGVHAPPRASGDAAVRQGGGNPLSPAARRPVATARSTPHRTSVLAARPAAPLATTNGKGRPAARLTERLEVRKTYKLYIGGQFPRTESGRA